MSTLMLIIGDRHARFNNLQINIVSSTDCAEKDDLFYGKTIKFINSLWEPKINIFLKQHISEMGFVSILLHEFNFHTP